MTAATRGPGPAAAVAARPGTGLTRPDPWLVEVPPGEGVQRVLLPGVLAGTALEAGTQLCWTVFPEGTDDLESRWDATALAVDLLLDDGTWLSASGALDQYAGAVDPAAQAAARRTWVDQWNLRRVTLDPVAGRRVREAYAVVVASPRRALRAHVDEVEVRPVPTLEPGLGSVDTRRGSHSSDRFSRGNNAPLVGLPHGGVFGLPTTDATSRSWPYSWAGHLRDDARPALQAFATSHLPSPWMGDRGVFQMMPSASTDPDVSPQGRALGFDHADEHAGPHRYAVRLDGGVTAELTAGEHALGMRFGLPEEQGSLVLDHHGTVTEVQVAVRDGVAVVELRLDDREGTPPHFVHLRVAGAVAERLTVEDGRLQGSVMVRPDARGQVEAGLGISTVDVAQARKNLSAAGDFDQMCGAAETAWRGRLAAVEVAGETADQQVSLASGLYRSFLYPNRMGERAGRDEPAFASPYPPFEVIAGEVSTTNGFWDTYRTEWPLLALLEPGTAGELAQGFVRHADLCGWTPRWSAPGAEDCMTGTTLDVVLADLALRGVPGIDLRAAYDTVLKNATVPADDQRVGRKGLSRGIFRGYIDTATHEGMSWTLDNAINDWGGAQLAARLAGDGAADDADHDWAAEHEYLARRSLSYALVFDRDSGFFRGRDVDGAWRPGFDPAEWGHDYTETNAWGTRFTAPHDGAGLVRLYGGEERFGAALDALLAAPETAAESLSGHYGFVIHEMAEARDVRLGMLGLSNQPAHHIPFMYMFAGRHDDAHAVVRDCLDRLFVGSDLGQGYPGDEDNGEMSAWWTFATVGLYPLVPATGTFVLLPPAVPQTRIRPLGGDAVTTITVPDFDPAARFVRAVRVDGEPWHEITLPHEVLARGSRIEFDLARTPQGWARDSRPPSASQLHGFRTPPADLADAASGVAGATALVDDAADHDVRLRPGDAVTVRLCEPSPISLLSLTIGEPATISIAVEVLAGDTVVQRTELRDARFRWARQTRVFSLDGAGGAATGVRLTALEDCSLRQVEVLAADPSRADDPDLDTTQEQHRAR